MVTMMMMMVFKVQPDYFLLIILINNNFLLISLVKYKHFYFTSTVERLQLNRRHRAHGSLSFTVDKRRPLQ